MSKYKPVETVMMLLCFFVISNIPLRNSTFTQVLDWKLAGTKHYAGTEFLLSLLIHKKQSIRLLIFKRATF